MSRSNAILASALLLGVVIGGPAQARMNKAETQAFQETVADLQDARARLQRLERLFEASHIQQMYLRMQDLEAENRRLRGELEELTHRMQKLAQREKEIDLDMDKRLQALETRRGAAAGAGDGFSATPAADPDATGDEGTYPPDEEFQVLDEQGQYRQSFEFLKSGQYPAAIEGFRNFIKAYPDSSLAPNARYWLGEAHYGAGQFEKAARNFEMLRANHPGSGKVADASLKLGYSLYELGKWDDAKKILKSVIAQFPDSSVARLAEKRLQRIKAEGH